jgi:membrane protease YdiL (CAAX protease family)
MTEKEKAVTLNLSNRLKRFQVVLFFALSLMSWVIWVPQACVALGISVSAIALDSPMNVLAVWAPGLAAIVVTVLTTERAGVRRLFRPILTWRVGIRWYVFVLFFPIGTWLVARVIDILLGQSYELGASPILAVFGPEQSVVLPFVVAFALPNALGEELGWRGFGLPKLQARYNALVSSIILGLFWGFWHIPAWIAQGQMGLSLVSILVNVLCTVPAAVIFTWVYNNTNCSLLLVWLLHTSMTIMGYFVPPLPTPTGKILSWAVAILVVIMAGPTRLRRHVR